MNQGAIIVSLGEIRRDFQGLIQIGQTLGILTQVTMRPPAEMVDTSISRIGSQRLVKVGERLPGLPAAEQELAALSRVPAAGRVRGPAPA